MRVNESAAASTKVVGAAAKISRALYRVLTVDLHVDGITTYLGIH